MPIVHANSLLILLKSTVGGLATVAAPATCSRRLQKGEA